MKTDAKFLRINGNGNSANLWNGYTEVRINIIVAPPPIDPPIDPPVAGDTVRLKILGGYIDAVIE